MVLTKGLNFIPKYRYHDETAAYAATIAGAPATISTRSLQHVDKFVRDCKEAGVWSKLLEVAPFCGTDITAGTAKLKYATLPFLTAVNFVAGDYSEATGLTGDAATKYLNMNFSGSLMPATSHLAFYQRTDNTSSSTRVCLGGNDATDDFWLGAINPIAQTDARLGKLITATGAGQMVRGFYYAERKSMTDLKVYRNNTQIAANATSVVHAAPNLNLYAWARNNIGVAGSFNHMSGSFLSIGTDLSATERTDYYSIIQTLQVNLGRAV